MTAHLAVSSLLFCVFCLNCNAGEELRPSQIIAQAVATGELTREDTHGTSSDEVVLEMRTENAEAEEQRPAEENEGEDDDSKEVRIVEKKKVIVSTHCAAGFPQRGGGLRRP